MGKKMVKTDIQILATGLKLLLICAVAAVSLAVLNEITEPVIIARKAREENETLGVLVPEARFEAKVFIRDAKIVQAYYRVVEKDIYILDLLADGYGGKMKILAAYRTDGELLEARLLDNQETPGLGKKAEDPDYFWKFKGKGGNDGPPIPISKEMLSAGGPQQTAASDSLTVMEWFFGRVSADATSGATDVSADSVSGATLTFLGVSRALAEGSRFVKEYFGG